MRDLERFVAESNAIEGIWRAPTQEELDATAAFLSLPLISFASVCRVQAVYAPGKPLRNRVGMNVRVGEYIAPPGSPDIQTELVKLCARVLESKNPWREHVAFETLHPFMDGNGRTGRAIWAWHMLRLGRHPFDLPFLHRFYYQTLENSGDRSNA